MVNPDLKTLIELACTDPDGDAFYDLNLSLTNAERRTTEYIVARYTALLVRGCRRVLQEHKIPLHVVSFRYNVDLLEDRHTWSWRMRDVHVPVLDADSVHARIIRGARYAMHVPKLTLDHDHDRVHMCVQQLVDALQKTISTPAIEY